jgi:hypothetical protein
MKCRHFWLLYFRRSNEFYANFYKNNELLASIPFLASLLLLTSLLLLASLLLLSCLLLIVCLLLLAFLLAAGVPLVPDVLTMAGFTAFAEGVPGFVAFSAVAFFRAVVGITAAVAGVPAVDDVFGVASFPADLSDYRISDSQITIGWPPLLI